MKLHEHIESLDMDNELGNLEFDNGVVTGAMIVMKIESPDGGSHTSVSYINMNQLERIGAMRFLEQTETNQ